MRIAYFFHDRPDYVGGPTIKARRLLPELARRGHEVVPLVFYRRGRSPVAEALRQIGLQPRARSWPRFTERQISWTLSQIIDMQPDVFFCGSYVGPCFAARWVRAAGIPTIAACLSVDDFHWGLAEQFAGDPRWAASAMACISDAVRSRVARLSPPRTKLATVIHGVPIPTRQATQTGPVRLVYLGRLVHEAKRISRLLEAIIRVLRTDPSITARILGSGWRRKALEERVQQEGLTDRITFTGAVPPDELDRYLLDCHILVHLPDYEGLGSAVIHGMAHGLVPVCLDAPGGLRELVIHEQTGLMVHDCDGQFRAAIARLTADEPLRMKLAENAREHIKRRFSLEESANQWERLFADVLAEAGPRRPIRVPWRFGLPPVNPKLAEEDVRRRHVPRLLLGEGGIFLRRVVGRIRREFSRKPA